LESSKTKLAENNIRKGEIIIHEGGNNKTNVPIILPYPLQSGPQEDKLNLMVNLLKVEGAGEWIYLRKTRGLMMFS